MLLLTPEQQAAMVEDEPRIFSPVPGGWGRKGAGAPGQGGAGHIGSCTVDCVAEKSAEAPLATNIQALGFTL